MPTNDFVASVMVGLIGGVASGLLGVSPGGILVPITILVLGCEQHIAQAISLVAQIPPTSISGIRRYWRGGRRTPMRWLALLTVGFLIGGVAGALAADRLSSEVLQWAFVFYLALLVMLLVFRPPDRRPQLVSEDAERKHLDWPALVIVGLVAGFSSGLMGIGGGLAITAGLSAGLKVPQHQAQAVSLAFSAIPTTIPAAWVYWHHGWFVPWPVIAGLVVGLWGGTYLGARVANRLAATTLRHVLIGLVSATAVYMAYKAHA